MEKKAVDGGSNQPDTLEVQCTQHLQLYMEETPSLSVEETAHPPRKGQWCQIPVLHTEVLA